MVDLSKIGRPSASAKSLNPLEIFGRLPATPSTPNDLWSGQSEALRQWHDKRDASDVLISLNTGAGKTVVGLLVAQSLINEGLENVVYACSTVDLVNQTYKEATALGIKCTTRARGRFNNDLFETGEGFCITTYQALYTVRSGFHRKFFPEAIIFDDSHVAESILRSAMTMTIRRTKFPDLFGEIVRQFTPAFEEHSLSEAFKEVVGGTAPDVLMAPPDAVRAGASRITGLIKAHKLREDDDLQFPYLHLIDHISNCVFIFGDGVIEISPPFLPVRSLPYFDERGPRRIYLSATMNYMADFPRAFGREPEVVIQPENDAGNGERLVLFAEKFDGHEVDIDLVKRISREHKVLISVPSYPRAKLWEGVGQPPSPSEFSEELQQFRDGERQLFILVSRIDGIDLPHATCRLMVVDGLPGGANLIERYQWDRLGMRNFHAAKLANRITQLFGRINRGRNDYGVFILNGRDLNNWLLHRRHLALLPDLLRKQLLLGTTIQEQSEDLRHPEGIVELVDQVIERDEDWLALYADTIEGLEIDDSHRIKMAEMDAGLTDAAISEAEFGYAIWNNDFASARKHLEEQADLVADADSRVAGWYWLWVGHCYQCEGDNRSASLAYARARVNLRGALVPRVEVPEEKMAKPEEKSAAARKIWGLVGLTSDANFNREISMIDRRLAKLKSDTGSSSQHEEAVRFFGEVLGYSSSRPDNELGDGPDVLWREEKESVNLGLELKTKKDTPANYRKKDDIGQGHDNLEWIREKHKSETNLGLVFIGPPGSCTASANPSDEMFHLDTEKMIELIASFVAGVRDIRRVTPMERAVLVDDMLKDGRWSLKGLFEQMPKTPMKELAVD